MKTLKEMIEDRMSELNQEMELLEDLYKIFPEPSVQLERYNDLNDEYWLLEKQLRKLSEEKSG